MTIPLERIRSMPAFSPYYPMPPASYRNVRFHYVFFRADVSAVDRVLPECFEPASDGLCVAIGLEADWSANYGRFAESVLLVKCKYEGKEGYFAPVVFLNSRSSIPAGREIYGTPKVFAELKIYMDERVMVTDTRLAGTSIMSIRSTMHRHATIDELPRLEPSWRLKVIPRADGKGVDLMQLIDVSNVTTDVVVHVIRSGDGVVDFSACPVYDLSDFTPRQYVGAYYVEMDYNEGYADIVKELARGSAGNGETGF